MITHHRYAKQSNSYLPLALRHTNHLNIDKQTHTHTVSNKLIKGERAFQLFTYLFRVAGGANNSIYLGPTIIYLHFQAKPTHKFIQWYP